MTEERCSICQQLYAVEDLLVREDTGERVCEKCSGLLAEDDLNCQYDEEG